MVRFHRETKKEEAMFVTDRWTDRQAGRRLDSAPTANVVALARKIGPRWSSPLVDPNISGLSGIQDDSWAILSKNSPNLPKFRCHGSRIRLHNILHGSIESAIPKNPMVGANISGLSAILAELYALLCPNFVAMVTRVGPTTMNMVPLNRPSPKTP